MRIFSYRDSLTAVIGRLVDPLAGRITFSRDGTGRVLGLHLASGRSVDVREHQWIAATDTVDYTFTRVKDVANTLRGGTAFSLTPFPARSARPSLLRIQVS